MITLALIGKGSWGKNYIKTIRKLPKVQLKYIVSSKKENEISYKKNSFILLDNYEKLFQYKDIDGVIIASPASTHFRIARDCIKRNYNVLIEKPLTSSLQDALELKMISKKSTSIVFVGHIYAYNPAFQKAKELAQEVGNIQYLEFEGHNFGPFRQDTPALWDWGPHDISMCLEIMESIPTAVAAWGTGDIVFLRLVFQNDIQAFIKIGWLSPVKTRRVIIVGSKGSIIFDDTQKQKVALYKNRGSDFLKKTLDKKPEIFYPKLSKVAPLLVQLKEFITCIQNRKQPKTSIESGIDVVEILHYAEKSLEQNGKKIKIN